jgi:hypothetical protein
MMCLFRSDLTQPVTAYANSGGQGDRTASITVTMTATALDALGSGGGRLINGDKTANSTGSLEPLGTVSANQYLRFDFGAAVKKYIDEITLFYNNGAGTPNNGSWKWQGSNDASVWTDLATFTWDALTKIVTLTGLDFGGYRYYQMICPAGHSLTNDWFEEVEFKIAPGA